jgi:Amino acid synthesis
MGPGFRRDAGSFYCLRFGSEESMTEIRKIVTLREVVFSELGRKAARPVVRAVGIGVIRNPFAGGWAEDLRPLFEAGAGLGERLMPELVKLLDGPAVSYGKGALVGVAGEMEHGGACVHPMLGRPMRAAIGGGQAVIGSNVKVAAPGAPLDVPLGHKDDSWSFEHFDTVTVSVADAPRPDEIVVVMAIADGGRLANRCGTAPIR